MIILRKAQPTPAEIEAGNYKKRHRRFRGLDITIESPAGSVREGTGPNGKRWRTKMRLDYGYIRRTEGADGDHVDCYVGPDEEAPNVYVVHQRKAGDWQAYDEDKSMLGFPNKAAAVRAYLAHYDDKRFLGEVTVMPFDEFKDKVLATKDKPGMVKAALIFLKAHVRGHTRRLRSGKVVTVAPFERRGDAAAAPQASADHAPQTDTPEFRRWFGDSKVVDAGGKPLVVYHGSYADIDEFDPSMSGSSGFSSADGAIEFTDDPYVASHYAGASDQYARVSDEAGAVYPVYLKIERPFVITRNMHNGNFSVGHQYANAIKRLREGDDSPDMMREYGVDEKYVDAEKLADAWEKGGIDGIVIEGAKWDAFDSDENTQYIVFDPKQIKSASGNSGAFDQDSPKITKSAPMVVFVKSYVRAHVRRTKDGKVISVGSYHNSVVPEPAPLRGRGKDTLTGDLFGAQPPKGVDGKKQDEETPDHERGEDGRRSALAMLPKQASFRDGKGIASGKVAVEIDGDVVSNYHEKPEDAAKEAMKFMAQNSDWEAKSKAEESAIRELRSRLVGGGLASDNDLKLLGLRPGSSGMKWFIPAAARLFGVSPRAIRPIVSDMIVNGKTESGADVEFVPPKKALRAIADQVRAGGTAAPTVTAPASELIDEHRRLVQVLESPSHADDKAEAAKQREELRGYEGRAGNVRPSYEDVFDLISQYAPKVQPLFADGWQRFPAGNYARQVKEELIRQADYQKERRPHVASALVRAAAEITRREAEESKPTISPSPGAAAGGDFGQPLSMLKDGLDGVDLGTIGEAQYALGADGEVYRRRGDEAGTYGGWRWQFKASHAAQYRKDPLLGAIAERVADLVGSSPMVDGAAASPASEEPKFIGDADAGQTINGGKVKVIGNFKTKAAAEAAASKSDTYRVTGYEGGKFARGWVVEEATSGARPVFQGWKRENANTRSISTRSGRFVAHVANSGAITLTDRKTSRTWRGEAADKKNPLATVSEVAAAMEFMA